VNAYRIVLYVHLVSLLLATGAAAVTHVAHHALRRARTLSEAGRCGLTMKSAARAFPPAVVGLFGSGAYMVSDAWSWSAAWVVAAVAGLAAIVLLGDLVNGRNGRALGQAIGRTLAAQGDGPVTAEVTRLLESRLAIAASFTPTLLMLGVVYLMTAKPGAAGCAAALLVPLAASAAAGQLLAHPVEGVPAEADA
jgi:hypothetical protein